MKTQHHRAEVWDVRGDYKRATIGVNWPSYGPVSPQEARLAAKEILRCANLAESRIICLRNQGWTVRSTCSAILILMLAASVAAGQQVTDIAPSRKLFERRLAEIEHRLDFIPAHATQRVSGMRYAVDGETYYVSNALTSYATTASVTRIFDTNATILAWAADGSICAVLGHQWLAVWTVVGIPIETPDNTRKCGMCGKIEKKREEWR